MIKLSRIIFVPVCEKCGHEFTELDFTLSARIQCPRCGEILDNLVIPRYDYMCHQDKDGQYIAAYSKDDYY